jgi:hypothetical protein
MTKRKIYLTAILLVGIMFTTLAQTSLFTIGYSTALPLGETGDYIDKFSWRGISIEQRYFIERDLSVGFYIGWNVLNQKLENHTVTFDNGVLYGTQYRYINTWPILAIVHYHFMYESTVRPYVGTGLGIYSVNKQTEMGLYYDQTKSWQFGLQPEVGLWFDAAPGVNLMIAAKYNYAFKSQKGDPLSFLNFNFGLSFVY